LFNIHNVNKKKTNILPVVFMFCFKESSVSLLSELRVFKLLDSVFFNLKFFGTLVTKSWPDNLFGLILRPKRDVRLKSDWTLSFMVFDFADSQWFNEMSLYSSKGLVVFRVSEFCSLAVTFFSAVLKFCKL